MTGEPWGIRPWNQTLGDPLGAYPWGNSPKEPSQGIPPGASHCGDPDRGFPALGGSPGRPPGGIPREDPLEGDPQGISCGRSPGEDHIKVEIDTNQNQIRAKPSMSKCSIVLTRCFLVV